MVFCKTHRPGGESMKNYNWIDIEELPVRANLKVVRINDPDYGMTQDEINDRNEFIRCFILQDFEAILRVPAQRLERDFFIENWEESAFNTIDYFRDYPQNRFYRYAYRMRKIMEAGSSTWRFCTRASATLKAEKEHSVDTKIL